MAARKVDPVADKADNGQLATDKIARLLGMLLTKDIAKKADKVPILRSAGFSVAEVGDMLDMKESHVRVADHRGRKKNRK